MYQSAREDRFDLRLVAKCQQVAVEVSSILGEYRSESSLSNARTSAVACFPG